MDFRTTLRQHLAPIQSRDLAAFLAAVADDAGIILSNRAFIQGFTGVTDMHCGWFADTGWSLEAQALRALRPPRWPCWSTSATAIPRAGPMSGAAA